MFLGNQTPQDNSSYSLKNWSSDEFYQGGATKWQQQQYININKDRLELIVMEEGCLVYFLNICIFKVFFCQF